MPDQQKILLENFNREYNKLNEKQKQAVDLVDGPVMVIAGPGTGKTQILSMRIARILLEKEVFPDNILCLTYTDSAATAMRKRLHQIIGADAWKVNIFTFHGFCNQLIQENLSLFEKTELNQVSDLERTRILKSLIDNFSNDNPLKKYRGDVYSDLKNLQFLFSHMKREGWQPSFIKENIEAYLEKITREESYKYQVSGEGFEKGDFKPGYFQETIRMQKLLAAVNEFDTFQNLMSQNNFYDFDDMILWVCKSLKENPLLLESCREKFRFLLVDEFQDTSGAQNEIIQLLMGSQRSPNVFVVGDDDQSIFRFQGANIENMFSFANSFENVETVVLEDNYRSTKPILDISKFLIDKNHERLIHKLPNLNKNLACSNEKLKGIETLPEFVCYRNEKEEMAGIATKVEGLLAKGIAPEKIAVIYKENNYGERLLKYFSLKNIPSFCKRSTDVLTHPFIEKLITVLKYLAAEHEIPFSGDEMLFKILHYDFYSIPPIEIAKLSVEVNQKNFSRQPTFLRKVLYEKAHPVSQELFTTGANARLKAFSTMMESLIGDVPNVTLTQLFEKIISRGGVLPYVMNHADKIGLLQLLETFFSFLKEEVARDPMLDLQRFVQLLDLMQNEKLALPYSRISGTEKGVNLLTVHGSKGLEFEHVFITGMNAHLWEKKNNRTTAFKFPNTLFSSLPSTNPNEELRRLFYVAITRAEKHLQISWVENTASNKDAQASMFVSEILEERGLSVQKAVVSEEELIKFEVMNYSFRPQIETCEKDFIEPLVAGFVMSVSALNSYLDCPLSFYYSNLIRIPSGKSESMEFGSAIHFALQRLFEEMQKDPSKKFPSKEWMIENFRWFLSRRRGNFTKEAFGRRMEYGEKVLAGYYENYVSSCNKIVAVERNIKNVMINGIPLKGKIDKMEFNGNEINVVDYKTGDVNSEYNRKKLLPPNEAEPNGGDYWRQAVFYKMLIDQLEGKEWKVASSEFDFVEPDKNKGFQKRKITINPADIETVKQQIKMVWEKIQAHDFYTGCGKESCHWCGFVKNFKAQCFFVKWLKI